MPPTTKLVVNLGVAVVCKYPCGRIHADRSFARAFNPNILVSDAKGFELLI
jgi:hypothetical protein